MISCSHSFLSQWKVYNHAVDYQGNKLVGWVKDSIIFNLYLETEKSFHLHVKNEPKIFIGAHTYTMQATVN